MTFPTTNAGLVRTLANTFKACPIDGMIRYEDLSRAIGGPIGNRLYLAHQGMQLANQETGAIFVNVRLEGYRRMPHDEAHAIGQRARTRIRGTARRAAKTITNVLVVANDMTDAARIKAYSEQAALGLLQHMTYDRNRPIIADGSSPPPTHETIRASVEALRAARREAASRS